MFQNRLFDEYSEIYDKIIDTPPNGKEPRVSKVVKIDLKAGSKDKKKIEFGERSL